MCSGRDKIAWSRFHATSGLDSIWQNGQDLKKTFEKHRSLTQIHSFNYSPADFDISKFDSAQNTWFWDHFMRFFPWCMILHGDHIFRIIFFFIFRILGDKRVQKWLLHDLSGKGMGCLKVKIIIDQRSALLPFSSLGLLQNAPSHQGKHCLTTLMTIPKETPNSSHCFCLTN